MRKHPFHLVDPSPWPLLAALAATALTAGGVLYFHAYPAGGLVCAIGFTMVLYSMFVWWRDVIREATFEGHHTRAVQLSMRYGMLLFIASEVMFFLAFFWSFFHSSLAPAVDIGATWPPRGVHTLSVWEIPFVNTLLLLSSGASVTYAHHAIASGQHQHTKIGLIITLALAAAFTALQAYEYVSAKFTIASSVYGATFFMATGFHGAHVIIGSVFLAVCLVRALRLHFTKYHHFGFEAAAWYYVQRCAASGRHTITAFRRAL